jgi:hypothetical protein
LDKARRSESNLFWYKNDQCRRTNPVIRARNIESRNSAGICQFRNAFRKIGDSVTSTGTAFCARLKCRNDALPFLPTNGGRMMKVTKIAFAAALGTAALCGPVFAQDQGGGYAGAQAAAPSADAQTRAQGMAQNSTSKHTRKHQMSGNAQGSATAPADQAGSAASGDSQSSQGASSTQAPSPAQ